MCLLSAIFLLSPNFELDMCFQMGRLSPQEGKGFDELLGKDSLELSLLPALEGP